MHFKVNCEKQYTSHPAYSSMHILRVNVCVSLSMRNYICNAEFLAVHSLNFDKYLHL